QALQRFVRDREILAGLLQTAAQLRDLLVAELLIDIASLDFGGLQLAGTGEVDGEVAELLLGDHSSGAQRIAPPLALGEPLDLRIALDQVALMRDTCLLEREQRL